MAPVIEEAKEAAPRPSVERSALNNSEAGDATPREDFAAPEDGKVYLSESEHVNETMGFPVMVDVIHRLGFVRWNYAQLQNQQQSE